MTLTYISPYIVPVNTVDDSYMVTLFSVFKHITRVVHITGEVRAPCVFLLFYFVENSILIKKSQKEFAIFSSIYVKKYA